MANRCVLIGTTLMLLSGCVADRDQQYASCGLQHPDDADKRRLCMEASGYELDLSCLGDPSTYTKNIKQEMDPELRELFRILPHFCWVPTHKIDRVLWHIETSINPKAKNHDL